MSNHKVSKRVYAEYQKRTKTAICHTMPHGAQIVYPLEEKAGAPYDGNRLYTLLDDQYRTVVFTGEELTSLALQWLKYTEGK